MKDLKKSEFLRTIHSAAATLLSGPPPPPNFDVDHFVSLYMEAHGLTEVGHRFVEGHGYAKPCPIANAIKHIARLLQEKNQPDSADTVMTILLVQEAIEAAWEEYQILLKSYQDTKLSLAS